MKKSIVIPTVKFGSEYFKCPKCGWTYPGPIKVLGDVARSVKCGNCGHVGLERIK